MSSTTQYFVTLPCPVCQGTGDVDRPGMKPGVDLEPCRNCGGQTMSGNATGRTRPRRDNGEPCVHEYTGRQAGRCYYVYTCKHCGDSYGMDSGD